MDTLYEWLAANRVVLQWLVGVSIASAIGTLLLVPILIARVRPDYFLHEAASPDAWSGRHPILRVTIKVGKNLLGAGLLVAGIWMLVLPGQGILTILIGVMLLDFPGKRRLELSMVRRRGVLRAINWIRRRADRAPLQVNED